MPRHEPMNRGWMTSVTSIVPSGRTAISASKRWMTNWRAAAGAGAASSRKPARSGPASVRPSVLALLIGRPSLRLRGRGAEADLGCFALGWRGDLEELARLEAEHPGDDVRRELSDLRVEVADGSVVVAPRVLDGVFDLGQCVLELREAFHRAKLRVSLSQGKQLPQRAGEHTLRLALGRGALGTHGAVARVDNRIERALFVRGVALDGFHDVGNQVVASLELHVNVGPGIVALHLQAHQAVVNATNQQYHSQDDKGHDQHREPLLLLRIGPLARPAATISPAAVRCKVLPVWHCLRR